MNAASESPVKKTTLRTLRQIVEDGAKFPVLTCYDAVTAKWLVRGGVNCLLVGDTAAQMVLGYDSTLPVKMPVMLELTAAVRRGAPQAYVIADMPFGSYQCGDDDAMRNAIAFVADAGADAVKFELDTSHAPLVARLAAAGVPVVAHLGSLPQHKRAQGQSRAMVRSQDDIRRIVDQAEMMVDRGAIMVLLEAVPAEVGKAVVEAVTRRRTDGLVVPVIGCGAGPECHAHVVVLHDLLGLTDWHAPFVKPLAQIGQNIADAAKKWDELIRSGNYLRDDHPYRMTP
ncbi:MAG: 3-methyl-2-oxobutanoate hydroxymethyltransferase [Phycisphaeraceae bacterium]|nr:3-methyl-2-oxobutanoate hydroxymethyltransferase [Phycisphaeraceae bacterium]